MQISRHDICVLSMVACAHAGAPVW